mmetsp:Transcript_24155/g.36892  ORF Transcript_24155/g.36892 Transcript_24155/m.36892 type:complete len:339 (+) Transcript_24155:1835-2851(+)
MCMSMSSSESIFILCRLIRGDMGAAIPDGIVDSRLFFFDIALSPTVCIRDPLLLLLEAYMVTRLLLPLLPLQSSLPRGILLVACTSLESLIVRLLDDDNILPFPAPADLLEEVLFLEFRLLALALSPDRPLLLLPLDNSSCNFFSCSLLLTLVVVGGVSTSTSESSLKSTSRSTPATKSISLFISSSSVSKPVSTSKGMGLIGSISNPRLFLLFLIRSLREGDSSSFFFCILANICLLAALLGLFFFTSFALASMPLPRRFFPGDLLGDLRLALITALLPFPVVPIAADLMLVLRLLLLLRPLSVLRARFLNMPDNLPILPLFLLPTAVPPALGTVLV